jgi:hypothetical protein
MFGEVLIYEQLRVAGFHSLHEAQKKALLPTALESFLTNKQLLSWDLRGEN